MLSVLAVIGKIIGFTLLGILGLLILILLIVLFVPLRYKLDATGGKYEDGVRVDAKGAGSYLLHAISVKGGFLMSPEEDTENGVNVIAKLLGFTVFPKKEKKKKDKDVESDDFDEAEILEVITAEGPKTEDQQPETPVQSAADAAEEAPAVSQEQPEQQTEEPAGDEDLFENASDHAEEPAQEETEEKEKKSLSEKLEGIKQKGESLMEKAEDLKAKAEKALDFVQDNATQEEIAVIFKRLGKALKHYIPKKFEGYARVGLSDPATTGKILMYWYSIAYPRVPDTFRLMGDFDEEVIEGDVHLKGHFRLNHIVWFGLRMLLDRRFRKLLKKGKKLAKELKGSDTEDDNDETIKEEE